MLDQSTDLMAAAAHQRWRRRQALAGAACLVMAAIASLVPITASYAQETASMKLAARTLTINASGQVTAVPDMAVINTGVIAEAESAKDAVAANSKAMSEVIASLTAAGLEAKDIQTSDFSVQPKYQYNQDNSPLKLVGYTVANQVTIRVRDVTKVGGVLDSVVQAGSNQINGIQFVVSKADTLQDEARKGAVLAARRKAEVYAEAAGVKLGAVLTISEGGGSAGPVPMARMAMAEKADAVPIAAGEQTLEVSVTVVWAIE